MFLDKIQKFSNTVIEKNRTIIIYATHHAGFFYGKGRRIQKRREESYEIGALDVTPKTNIVNWKIKDLMDDPKRIFQLVTDHQTFTRPNYKQRRFNRKQIYSFHLMQKN